jgi:hypothetical protein
MVAGHGTPMIYWFFFSIVETVPARQWLPFASSFLKAYADQEAITELKKHLVPKGIALVWWNVRTNFAKGTKVKRRLRNLRKAIEKLEIYRAAPATRVRQRRRASIICQEINPGMPSASSRTLAISDRAKAASPGMPRRLPTKR